jgi:hypothetical protein
MRYILLILCLLSLTGVAQSQSKASQFINNLMADRIAGEAATMNKVFGFDLTPNKSELFYQDSVGKNVVLNLRESLQAQKNVFHGVRNDSVYFIDSTRTRTVMASDDAQKRLAGNIFPDGSFHEKIEWISSDSLVITTKERQYITTQIDKMGSSVWGKNELANFKMITADTVNAIFANRKRDGWAEMQKRGVARIYNFSGPIFLRNDTFCLFYYGYSCGWRCGHGEVAVYKKVNGRWEHWSTLMSWNS